MKVHLHSIGCRLNQSEIETMARLFRAAGHEIVQDAAEADKVIVNTCAVTAEAARDARNLVHRLHRRNGNAEIIMTGCYAAIAPAELAALPGVGRIVGNDDKNRIPAMLDPRIDVDLPVFDREPLAREFAPGSFGRTRGFVKVQDGCDNRCTFCVTTIARGPGRSRRLAEVVAEVQALAEAGYREVVLTGVHLGSYGRDLDMRYGLRELTATILAHTDVARLRLSSLEPWDVAPGFFRLWENSRLLPHLHLPLQSGSDRVLRRMARRTSRAAFRTLTAEAFAAIPDLNLSTDLIAGFPGETETDFVETLSFVEELRFGRLHVFGYSPRPGTAAARMPGQIPGRIKKERVNRLIALGRELSLAYHRRYEGQTRRVLWEAAVGADAQGLRWVGYTDNYIRVSGYGPPDMLNRVAPAQLSQARPDGMAGLMISQDIVHAG